MNRLVVSVAETRALCLIWATRSKALTHAAAAAIQSAKLTEALVGKSICVVVAAAAAAVA